MKMNTLAVAGGVTIMLMATANGAGRAQGQDAKPLETALGYYLEGSAAWQRENQEHVEGSESPRFWIREYQWGPGRDVLLADVYAVFDGERCEPLVHFVHTWDAAEERVINQSFGANGMSMRAKSWREEPHTLVTEAEGKLPNGSSMRIRDVTDLSSPDEAISVGHRWNGDAWVAADSARWTLASERVCS